jgi:integrase
MRAELVQNIREGKRPQSLAEKRQIEEARRKAEAQKKLEDEKAQITFGRAADKYLEWAKTNKKDYSNDESRYRNHLKQVLSNVKLTDIDALLIEKLKNDLQKKALAPKTINHCLALIRTIYMKAISWNLYNGPVPTKGVKFPKNDNRRIRFLSHKEAHKLLKELGKVSHIVRDQAVIALHCGLRFGEIANLKWSDIDLDK